MADLDTDYAPNREAQVQRQIIGVASNTLQEVIVDKKRRTRGASNGSEWFVVDVIVVRGGREYGPKRPCDSLLFNFKHGQDLGNLHCLFVTGGRGRRVRCNCRVADQSPKRP